MLGEIYPFALLAPYLYKKVAIMTLYLGRVATSQHRWEN